MDIFDYKKRKKKYWCNYCSYIPNRNGDGDTQ